MVYSHLDNDIIHEVLTVEDTRDGLLTKQRNDRLSLLWKMHVYDRCQSHLVECLIYELYYFASVSSKTVMTNIISDARREVLLPLI